MKISPVGFDLLHQHQWFCLISQGGLLAVGLGSVQPFKGIDRTCLEGFLPRRASSPVHAQLLMFPRCISFIIYSIYIHTAVIHYKLFFMKI